MKLKILIVDDEKPLRDMLAKWFKPSYDCLTAPDAEQALKIIGEMPDLALMITDFKMPGESGIELARKAKSMRADLPVVILTAHADVNLVIEAMRDGVDDFFQKPVTDLNWFEERVAKAIRKAELEREVSNPKAAAGAEIENFTGKSPAMEKVYRLIRKVAPTGANVLIEGPSGSGKELVARAIHNLSKRAAGPFVALECAAFEGELLKSELFGYEPGTFTGGLRDGKAGCFEAAAGGTLFLDEIGEIDMPTQIALLRTLETRAVRRLGGTQETAVDFRLVTATNKNLLKMVADGTFREDLYYRLNVIDIHTPALKDHREDIAPLVTRFLKEFSAANGGTVKGIEPGALHRLEAYDWPGNVRQLRNVIEKMVVLASGEKLTVDDLPGEIALSAGEATSSSLQSNWEGEFATRGTSGETTTPSLQPSPSLNVSERDQILAALEQCKGNRTKAADLLGISRRTIIRKLKEWNLDK